MQPFYPWLRHVDLPVSSACLIHRNCSPRVYSISESNTAIETIFCQQSSADNVDIYQFLQGSCKYRTVTKEYIPLPLVSFVRSSNPIFSSDEFERVKNCIEGPLGIDHLFEKSRFSLSDQNYLYAKHIASIDVAGIKIGTNVIKVHDLRTLCPKIWLNDSIMNAFCQTCALSTKGKCVFMPSFFITKLKQGDSGIRAAKKWMRKASAYSASKIAFPIHVNGNHWAIGLFNLDKKSVEYYDSMQQHPEGNSEVVRFLTGVSRSIFDIIDEWKLSNCITDVPQQQNCYDCGVFACRFYHSLCTGSASFDFRQDNMDSSRLQIGFALLALSGVRAL